MVRTSFNVEVFLLSSGFIPTPCIRVLDSKDLSKSILLFRDDLFLAPSYFEFDEYNNIIITFCAHKQ